MNIVVKNLKRIKLRIWKFITFIDFGIICAYLVFLFSLYYSMEEVEVWIRWVVCFGLLIPGTMLVLEVQYRRKGYQWIWIFLRYIFSHKKYQNKNTTSLLMPYKKIKGNYVTIGNSFQINKKEVNQVIIAIKLDGFDISLLEEVEQQKRIDIVTTAFRTLENQFSLIKLENQVQCKEQQKNLINYAHKIIKLYKNKEINKLGYNARIKQLANYFSINENLQNLPEIIEQNWYLLLYGNDNEELLNQLKSFIKQINVANINCHILTGVELVQVLYNIYFPKVKISKAEIIKNQNNLEKLFNLNTVVFTKNNIKINNKHYLNVHNIFEYPLLINNRWLQQLLSIKNSTIVFNARQISKYQQRKVLEKSLGILETNLLNMQKRMIQKETMIHLDQINTLMDQIASQTEQLIDTNLLVITYDDKLKELRKNNYELRNLCKIVDFKIDHLVYQQFDGLSAVIPKKIDPLFNSNGVEMPLSSFAASYPFNNNNLNDKTGLFLGFNNNLDPIFFDQSVRNRERKNSNQLILGTSGSGKSFTTKKELNWHIATGKKVIIIDPEREYQQLSNYYNGQWIDVGKSTQGKINPLQIFNNLDDDNEDPLTSHLQFLEQFFELACGGLTRDEKAHLVKILAQLYEQFNITARNDFNKMNAKMWPTLNDLHQLIEKIFIATRKSIYKDLALILSRFAANGIDAKLWNGYSTINENNNLLTVFDLYTLTESGNKRVINSQIFLILKYIEAEVRKNKNYNEINEEKQWVVITVDEAHLLIDKQFPAALYFMFSMIKRIRKYNGMMNIITQNINDFVGDDEIRRETTAIINGVQYLKCLQLSPHDLTALQKLYSSYGGISEIESNSISRFNVGDLLFSLGGHNRMEISIAISDIEKKAILG